MRTIQELKKMLVGSDPNAIDSTEQDAIFNAFTSEEKQEVLRKCEVEYQPAIDTSKAGDMANEAGSLVAWAEAIEANAKTVRALAALSLGIEHADVSFIYLNGEPEQLEEGFAPDSRIARSFSTSTRQQERKFRSAARKGWFAGALHPKLFVNRVSRGERGAMKDIKLPTGRLVSEKEERRFRKLSPKTWEGPPRQLTLEDELEWDEDYRVIAVENITAAAKLISQEAHTSPTADRYLATSESVNHYRDSFRRWLDSFTSKQWIHKDSAMDGLPWNEKLCLFQALLYVVGECGEDITEEAASSASEKPQANTAGA